MCRPDEEGGGGGVVINLKTLLGMQLTRTTNSQAIAAKRAPQGSLAARLTVKRIHVNEAQ